MFCTMPLHFCPFFLSNQARLWILSLHGFEWVDVSFYSPLYGLCFHNRDPTLTGRGMNVYIKVWVPVVNISAKNEYVSREAARMIWRTACWYGQGFWSTCMNHEYFGGLQSWSCSAGTLLPSETDFILTSILGQFCWYQLAGKKGGELSSFKKEKKIK